MARIGIAVILSIVLVGPIRSFAATAITTYQHPTVPDVFITELQTASSASSGEEFIELYNNTDHDIDLSDTAHAGKDAWKLQYFSSTKLTSLIGTANWASPYRTISLTGVAAAHDYYLLAGMGYNPGSITPDQTYTSTLADDGGALQLIDSSTTGTNTITAIHDQLAWSTDKSMSPSPLLFAAPGAGASLQRLPNSDNQYVNSDNSLTTFTDDPRISPDNAWTPPAPTPADPITTGGGSTTPDDGDTPTTPTVPSNTGLPAPIITELLPNPASPQTDEANEYIELYNPADTTFDLSGYTLETGTVTLHDFTITSDTVLAPHAYQAFYSAETGLSLSNSGGQARLLDPGRTVLSQSNTYGTAPDGQAWALDNATGMWLWTITPTPGAENLISIPLAKVSVIKTAAKKKAITTKVKGKSTVKKAKKAKATKKKRVKKQTAAATLASSTSTPVAPIHPGVLAAVGVLAVGYGVYEYRQDIANKLYQFRSNRAARRKARG